MKNTNWLLVALVIACCGSCSRPVVAPLQSTVDKTVVQSSRRPASIGIVGDTSNINTAVDGGVVLMGGGKDVDAAFQWMMGRSGGGDVVIIRASGTDAYN